MKRSAYLSLGSNLGDRRAHLEQSLARLVNPELQIKRLSSIYESEPMGPLTDQPDFLNAVAELETTLEPRELLAHCQAVEKALGRKRQIPKGPRTVDLDLLLIDQLVLHGPELILPHPELTRRAFVLEPLLEIAPALFDPRDRTPLARHLVRLEPQRVSKSSEQWSHTFST
jgi:2-amino-4-hydroxy-6-hydroxymethyldihydropteridine diphosphokinase